MLLEVLTGSGTFMEKLLRVLILVFCVFLSLSVHEMSHGIGAYLMGDKTAKYDGRISMNPLRHLDPFGALCLFVFGFGWAKPVMVNPYNFKNKKAGMVLTSVAGPLSNFIFAFVAFVGMTVIGNIQFSSADSVIFDIATVCFIICSYLVSLNIGLGVFNLIPIPPLDGSKILNAILPQRIYFKIMEYERYGFIILLILLNTPIFDRFLGGVSGAIISFYEMIINLFI